MMPQVAITWLQKSHNDIVFSHNAIVMAILVMQKVHPCFGCNWVVTCGYRNLWISDLLSCSKQ